jgi:cyanate lyase
VQRHEELGDGIKGVIDFFMDIVREPDPKGDWVNVVADLLRV